MLTRLTTVKKQVFAFLTEPPFFGRPVLLRRWTSYQMRKQHDRCNPSIREEFVVVLRFLNCEPSPRITGPQLFYSNVTFSTVFEPNVVHSLRQPLLPMAEGPAGNLTAKSIEIFINSFQ